MRRMVGEDGDSAWVTCVDRVQSCVERLMAMMERRTASKELKRLDAVNPSCVCDAEQHGPSVEVSRYCVSGQGTALATVDVEQEAAYWEVQVVTTGSFAVGVAQRAKDEAEKKSRLGGQLGDHQSSWALRSSALDLSPGDTIGVYLDQREWPTLKFTLNGEWVDDSRFISGIKGDVRPAVSVNRPTMVKFRFDSSTFKYPPSGAYAKFDSIIPARNVL
mmetsp:Transcript_16765/g.42578  ORF Transcript_16765/g.42578 Transcript_16765/m.42578 type:complete len:218 (+) Transcript_16765:156-809(+)